MAKVTGIGKKGWNKRMARKSACFFLVGWSVIVGMTRTHIHNFHKISRVFFFALSCAAQIHIHWRIPTIVEDQTAHITWNRIYANRIQWKNFPLTVNCWKNERNVFMCVCVCVCASFFCVTCAHFQINIWTIYKKREKNTENEKEK